MSRQRRSSQPAAVLWDLDGVIRHWDSAIDAGLEAEFGLPAGMIATTAFAQELLRDAVTGRITDEQWRAAITTRLAAEVGMVAAAEVVGRWSQPRGMVDPEARRLLAQVRRQVPIALVSNATTRLEADLATLGLAQAFDVVVNSARVGVAKPALGIYRYAVARLGVPAEGCVFIDDQHANVSAAATLGMLGVCFTGRASLRAALTELGLLG